MDRRLVAALALALAAAGCATDAPGQPVPAPGDPSAASPTSPSRTGKAPPINSPELDLTGFESRVCDLLAPAQLTPFAIRDPGKPRDDVAGPICTWNPPDTTAGVRVTTTILSKASDGWEGVYERRGKFPFFEETGEINGYPAVHVDTTTGGDDGSCATVVGVSRDLVFESGVHVNVRSSPEYKNACSVSDQVASLVIDTLRNGGR